MKRRDQQHREQPTLFGDAIDAALQTEPKLARDRDRKPSHDSAKRVRDYLPEIQKQLLAAFRCKPMTANEAAHMCTVNGGQYSRESYRKRAHELEKKGLIRIVGTRSCTVVASPVEVSVYQATPTPDSRKDGQ